MGREENRRMDWGKHKEVKLVHEVKTEGWGDSLGAVRVNGDTYAALMPMIKATTTMSISPSNV